MEDKKPETKKPYNEKDTIREFLNSENGVVFLIDKARETKTYNMQEQDIETIIDNLIDYYVTWLGNCKGKKAVNMTKYDFMCEIEKYCSEPDIKGMFNFLFY
ncbi:hypothetical protein TCON_1247 [Astathelohania contejeani]|uniref:Uncharacterized protein n=1 Tax=Astathelohania contejeani TaxID=164912 RepID=A0ABQ7HZB5_9MICR|nr:hypothetical protein TCON_1247 [Thelohania contejeani]